MTRDETRTAGLLFGEELTLGIIEPEALRIPAVQRAVRGLPVPSLLSRRYQQRQMRRGRLSWERHCAAPRMAARHAVLGDAAYGRPKLLVRVDGFPHVDAWEAPERVGATQAAAAHQIFRDAGVPYLMSVTPRISRRAVDPQIDEWRPHDEAERVLLRQLRRDGVAFGVHGLDHRSRATRHPSEFTGLKREALEERLDTAKAVLRDEALHADVFVPPFGRFDASCWPALASRFDVVCGGPTSVESMGFHATPTWRGDAVWLPSYAPLAGPAAQMLPVIRMLVEQQTSLWIPLVVHWDGELADGGDALRELCALLGEQELARSWEDFALATGASRQLASTFARDHG